MNEGQKKEQQKMPVLYSLFFSLAQTRIEPSVDQRRRQSWAALARTLVTRNEFFFVE
jgi:hypothetical protein